MTRTQLKLLTKKDLANRARKQQIAGWQTMDRDQLLAALLSAKKPSTVTPPPAGKPVARTGRPQPKTLTGHPTQRSAARQTASRPAQPSIKPAPRKPTAPVLPAKKPTVKSARDLSGSYGKDRIVTVVRDPFWLHCYWELTRQAMQRAEAALGQDWHSAKPILRLLDVTSRDTTCTSEQTVKDIPIHGGCNNWYIDVNNPPRSYRVDIGYLARSGRFYVLARSNVVNTPRPGASHEVDENWSDLDERQADRLFAMSSGFGPTATGSLELKKLFEERLGKPLGMPAVTSFGSTNLGFGRQKQFHFEMDAELIVFGRTEPNSRVTLQGEPVKVRPDGSFTMRFSLPDSRQIIPAVATSPDGFEERTIVLAVERNTKQLEPMMHEDED